MPVSVSKVTPTKPEPFIQISLSEEEARSLAKVMWKYLCHFPAGRTGTPEDHYWHVMERTAQDILKQLRVQGGIEPY